MSTSEDIKRLNQKHEEQVVANRLRIQNEDDELKRQIAAEVAARTAPATVPVVEAAVAPVTPAAPATPQEVVYEYQPVDEDGSPVGGKQVFRGATDREVLDKVAKAHQNATLHIRTLNRKLRLGDIEQENIPDDAQRYDASDFQPRVLSADERMELSREFSDPEKFDEAADRLLEAKLGARPDRIVQTLTQAQQDIAAMRARQEADLFIAAHPEYYKCQKNFKMLTDWMVKYNLAPIRANFELSYERLREAGLLLEAPIAREESPAPVTPAPVTPNNTSSVTTPEPVRISGEETAQNRRPVLSSSGLSNANSSTPVGDAGTQPQRKYTQADIERMSGDEYRRKLATDPEFKRAVVEIYDSPKAQVIDRE